MAYLGHSVEDLIEVWQNLALARLGDVVHALTGVISHTGILVVEAGQNWRDDLLKIGGYIWTKSNGSCGQSYEAAIAGVCSMNGVGEVMAELIDDLLDAVVVAGDDRVANELF